ncbi:MAG TPA: histidine kinase [Cyanobacteria bacterium UBA12227]|nr:histidine kinase [Cyanobacteria bacterium UBA12227]HAX84877.1 histidine kinase [Cyanobacteria bacterium UBA11370]HBY75446.1 histidine kinase [Cyanobacteria bacterium UBA11148]
MPAITLKILLVEDNSMAQTIALRILRSLDYQVDLVENGLEALEALRQKHYDVVLTDVQMPQMGGLEMARHICQEWSLEARPYIIALTSEVMPDIREECLQVGMNECISKPLDIDTLIEVLKKARI